MTVVESGWGGTGALERIKVKVGAKNVKIKLSDEIFLLIAEFADRDQGSLLFYSTLKKKHKKLKRH